MYTLLVLFIAYTAVYSFIWHLQSADGKLDQPRRRTAEIAVKAPPTPGSQAPNPAVPMASGESVHKV